MYLFWQFKIFLALYFSLYFSIFVYFLSFIFFRFFSIFLLTKLIVVVVVENGELTSMTSTQIRYFSSTKHILRPLCLRYDIFVYLHINLRMCIYLGAVCVCACTNILVYVFVFVFACVYVCTYYEDEKRLSGILTEVRADLKTKLKKKKNYSFERLFFRIFSNKIVFHRRIRNAHVNTCFFGFYKRMEEKRAKLP